jgi:hypothetical protein
VKFAKLIKLKLKKSRCSIAQRKFFVLSAIISISFNLFLGWFSQFLFISEFLKRANAELAAPIVGNQYRKDRDKALTVKEIPEITILKVTDADLNAAKESYPPSHRYHARQLEDLLVFGTPKALFIDIIFLDRRSEAHQLRNSLCELRKAGTKIYVASILPKNELSDDFKGFTQPANETLVWPVGDKACDLLAAEVSVRKQTDDFTNQAWSYCLDDRLAVETKSVDVSSNCQNIRNNIYGIKRLNSAAYQIYLDLDNAAIHLSNTSEMALTWGTERDEHNLIITSEKSACRRNLLIFDFLAWPNVIKDFFSAKSVMPFCHYFNELTIGELKQDENRDSLIDNHIVFYGYQLDGINDFSYTPTRGIQHAMNVHAMALDNMLVYANSAKSNIELFESKGLLFFNIVLQFVLILILELFAKFSYKYRINHIVEKCRYLPKMPHFNSLLCKLALISISPIFIFPAMWIGSGILNLGVMGWIEFAAIGFISEAIGLRHKIEDDLNELFNSITPRRYS